MRPLSHINCKVDTPDRSAAELEEEKYVDPFQQSTNELTPLSLPINPRYIEIISNSKNLNDFD